MSLPPFFSPHVWNCNYQPFLFEFVQRSQPGTQQRKSEIPWSARPVLVPARLSLAQNCSVSGQRSSERGNGHCHFILILVQKSPLKKKKQKHAHTHMERYHFRRGVQFSEGLRLVQSANIWTGHTLYFKMCMEKTWRKKKPVVAQKSKSSRTHLCTLWRLCSCPHRQKKTNKTAKGILA